MKKKQFVILFFLFISYNFSQSNYLKDLHLKVDEDLNFLIQTIKEDYVYLDQKEINLKELLNFYKLKIPEIQNNFDVVLFFENLLLEFTDSHFILNTNTDKSYRLYTSIYASEDDRKFFITDVWESQIISPYKNLLGCEIVNINGQLVNKLIEDFPVSFSDKNNKKVREWILNKIISGKYNEPRKLAIKNSKNSFTTINLDSIIIRKDSSLLNIFRIDSIGIIRINNSLFNNELVSVFDNALNKLSSEKTLVLDLRNTISGGNTYVARAIMGRFIEEEKIYQKHSFSEKYSNQAEVVRSWFEIVSPRKPVINKKLFVYVNRWTGSMGEGIAIGFDGMKRAKIIGNKMARLNGAVDFYKFKNFNFGFTMPTEKLFHINGTPRELFIPEKCVIEPQMNGMIK